MEKDRRKTKSCVENFASLYIPMGLHMSNQLLRRKTERTYCHYVVSLNELYKQKLLERYKTMLVYHNNF